MIRTEPAEHHILKRLPLQAITQRLSLRRLSLAGVAQLQQSIHQCGFLETFPLLVFALDDGTSQLMDGNHRFEAARAVGITCVPCLVTTRLSERERYTLAVRANRAAETVVPSTLVSTAEFVWMRLAEGYTQQEIAEMLGWKRGAVSNYARLQEIDRRAWTIIATTCEQRVATLREQTVAPVATSGAFPENLLREILPMCGEQQYELVQALANETMTKHRFTERAHAYRCRNEMARFACQSLGNLGDVLSATLQEEISSGAYDADWNTPDRPKLHKLLASLRDDWERKHRIHLIHGDFSTEVARIGDGSIDLILTDPPSNLAREQTFALAGRTPLSQDVGSWDTYAEDEFLALFAVWAREWARILRDRGSGYVFTADRYLSHLRAALETAGLHVKAPIVWHKTNPGTQVVKTNFRSSVEYLLFFTKGEGGHTFNWQGENAMHNFPETPICGGSERLVDGKGHTLHPTQKPEQVLHHFLEISSNRGDTVFDGFAGVGSTGKVAKEAGRKFIGIEQDRTYFQAMQRRLAE
ncbi:MAG TPA: DNA methyltransferase [Ktedonobacteraceae bacterium]|nr:DNA methyltransferase [Ktedonobacteraceae bacterium]